MSRRLIFLAGFVFAFLVMLIVAANAFPDQTWNAISLAQDAWHGIFLRERLETRREPQTPVPYIDPDGYAVMSAWKQAWAGQDVVFVRRDIRPDSHVPGEELGASCLPARFRYEYRPAMQDLQSLWNKPFILQDRFSQPEKFMLLSDSDLPVNDPRTIVRANARGYFAFSAVGFNHQRSRAAIWVIHWDGRFGTADVFFMKNGDKGWQIEGSGDCGWIT